jgi:hypothetical protein
MVERVSRSGDLGPWEHTVHVVIYVQQGSNVNVVYRLSSRASPRVVSVSDFLSGTWRRVSRKVGLIPDVLPLMDRGNLGSAGCP